MAASVTRSRLVRGWSRRSAVGLRLIASAMLGMLVGCGAEDFPGSPQRAGDLNVPYVTTYNFGLNVGFSPIFGVEGNLQIVSSGDLLNLVSAANTTRRPGLGVLGGRALTTDQGISAINVVLTATDVDGRRLGEFFYNSLGGTPDFVQTRGTTAAGAFTIFNVSPGEVFIKAVGGGRGSARLLSFPDNVSLGAVMVTPVVVPIIGVVGEITDDAGAAIAAPHGLGIEVVGQRLSEAISCADEIPTQDRVEAGVQPPSSPRKTAIHFCVASEGDFYARLTGDAAFVPTYQKFNTDSARLTALQTAELTEFFTIQSRAGLERAAQAAGIAWDPNKGVLAGQVQSGAGAARSGATVRIVDAEGTLLASTVGQGATGGVIVFPDGSGISTTGGSGRFIALNLPVDPVSRASTVYVSVTAERPTAGVPERFAATAIAPIMAGAVTYEVLNAVSLLPPIQGVENCDPYFTGPVSGRVMREDGLAPVGGAQITALGVPMDAPVGGGRDNRCLPVTETRAQESPIVSAGSDGRYEFLPNTDPKVTVPLLQSNTYLVRVDGPTTEFRPTYQRFKTGSAELDPATGRLKVQTQDLVAVTNTAIETFRTAAGLGPLAPGTGVLLGTVVDIKTVRPASGITVRLTALDGTDASPSPSAQSASVVYFDVGGVPRADLKATTADGRFIVFNVPPGSISLDVISPDDTGNAVVDSRADGVTVARLDVNNAAPATVDVSGRFTPLTGSLPAGGPLTLTAAGGDPIALRRLCPTEPGTESFERGGVCYLLADPTQTVEKTAVPCGDEATYGKHRVLNDGFCQLSYTTASLSDPFAVPVGSHQDVVFKTSGSGLVDAYTFGVRVADRSVDNVSMGAVTATALAASANSAGRVLSADAAVVWGRTITAGLGERDSQGALVPRTCAGWTELPANKLVGCTAVGTPGALVTGSFNDDGYRDLAVIDTTASDPAVTIWLNSGDGSFVRSQRIVRSAGCFQGDVGCGLEDGPVALVAVDYNRDGLSDLVVLNQQSRSISFLEGRSRGQFVFGGRLGVAIQGTNGPESVTDLNAMTSADFNRDGIPDLMITDRLSGRLGVCFGTGAGFMQPIGTNPSPVMGNDPRAVFAGQIDFDGLQDLVVVNRDTIAVMQGVGVTFTIRQFTVPAGSTPDFSAAVLGDADSDGVPDVVVADRSPGSPKVWVFHNSPFSANLLQTPTAIPVGADPVAVAVRDVNQDLFPDLVVVHQDGTVLYFEGDGAGGVGTPEVYAVGGRPLALVMDDVTGDGMVDAVLSDPAVGASRIVILPHTTQPVDGVAVAAVDADGRTVGEVVYLNNQGMATPGATATGVNGRFAMFNARPGPVWLRLLAGGLGGRLIHTYPGSVSVSDFPVVKGRVETTTIRGVTVDSVLRPVGGVQIGFLGTQRVTSSNPVIYAADGSATGGADYLAIVDANSEYVVKLSK